MGFRLPPNPNQSVKSVATTVVTDFTCGTFTPEILGYPAKTDNRLWKFMTLSLLQDQFIPDIMFLWKH